jgi:hypothetical protein
MKSSSLAERLEEYAATVEMLNSIEAKASPPLSVDPKTARPAPRRPAFATRRIQIRDEGLRPFRVS